MMCFDFHSVSLATLAPCLWRARSCVDVERVQRKSEKKWQRRELMFDIWACSERLKDFSLQKFHFIETKWKLRTVDGLERKSFRFLISSSFFLSSDELFRFRNSLHFWWLIMSRGREIPFGSCASASLVGGPNTHPMSCRDTSKVFSLLSSSCASNYSRWWYLFTLCVR